ncbi:MAG: iron-sulfur cluster assembly protein [Odoribacteraceae bacterium]|jgi:FeS assembly SUF system protein|nr:iron-sulfur cluster assembly protein [Odoribacteraceae bacterium]
MSAADDQLRQQVIEQLMTVYDPEVPVNVWDLGLIYAIAFPRAGAVTITMTLTAPGCPIADQILDEAREAALRVEGLEEATVNLVFDPPWGVERMSEEAKLELGFDIF